MYRILQKEKKKKKTPAPFKKREKQKQKNRQFHDFAKLRKTELNSVEPLFFRKPMELLITDGCGCC